MLPCYCRLSLLWQILSASRSFSGLNLACRSFASSLLCETSFQSKTRGPSNLLSNSSLKLHTPPQHREGSKNIMYSEKTSFGEKVGDWFRHILSCCDREDEEESRPALQIVSSPINDITQKQKTDLIQNRAAQPTSAEKTSPSPA